MAIGGIYLYAAPDQMEPFVPAPWPQPWPYPQPYVPPQPLGPFIVPDPAMAAEVAKLRGELEKLRHTQEGMTKLIEAFLKKGKRKT